MSTSVMVWFGYLVAMAAGLDLWVPGYLFVCLAAGVWDGLTVNRRRTGGVT